MKKELEAALQQAAARVSPEAGNAVPVILTRPRDKAHGDYATNLAMILASKLGGKPHDVAAALLAAVRWPAAVERAQIAGPGFINIHLEHASEAGVLARIVGQGEGFGRVAATGESVCVEYVSANPTGPMHVGHGRGAVVGDALANVLAACGARVYREYYINDAGAQIGLLADSVWLRMRELRGEAITLPADAYPGEYVIDVARDLMEAHGFDAFAAMAADARRERIGGLAVAAIMDMIRSDLAALGIEFDSFFSEKSLHASGRVVELIERLKDMGLIYEGVLPPPKGKEVADYQPAPQWLFRTTDFGDDVDRPLVKQDGTPTYFAADIAYHMDKHGRGFDRQVNVWGADHGGYVTRVQAAMRALTGKKGQPQVVLVQMVNLTREGRPVRMSKRAGTFVTLREVVDEVGRDAVRFNFLTRRAESQLDFDLAAAKQQSDENPVYYVQYAHARVCAILRKAHEYGASPAPPEKVDATLLTAAEERALIKLLLGYPEVLRQAGRRSEPHRLATYLLRLAAAWHGYYHKFRVIGEEAGLMQARLLLVRAIGQVVRNGLGLLGVTAPERM